jgi:hypothetical protein
MFSLVFARMGLFKWWNLNGSNMNCRDRNWLGGLLLILYKGLAFGFRRLRGKVDENLFCRRKLLRSGKDVAFGQAASNELAGSAFSLRVVRQSASPLHGPRLEASFRVRRRLQLRPVECICYG